MKKKILVVDNDILLLEFMEDLLSEKGYQVAKASDALSALDILKVQAPDMIFMDLVMPGIDGKKLCRIIRGMDRFKDVYIAILTASLAEEKIDIAELGAVALIAKGPFSEMSQHILDVINHPDLASSRCLSGDRIGIENRSSRGMTTELFSVNRSLNDVLQGIREGILEIAPDGRVVFANQAILSIIGEAEERALGSPLSSLFGEDNRQRIEELMKGSGGTVVESE